MVDEFDLIKRYFAPLSGDYALGLSDDASCIPNNPGFDNIVTKDLIIEGTHFRSQDPLESVAYKALAVNISDCIAKGASPHAYWLGLALPKTTDESWFKAFSKGLEEAQAYFGCSLAGGDTTTHNNKNIVISITMLAYVPAGKMIKRSEAEDADDIYVTGYLGDSALGLACLENNLNGYSELTNNYIKPDPPVGIQNLLQGIASASADVSDGLMADIGHICAASELGCSIKLEQLPISESSTRFLKNFPMHKPLVWSGGDDYQTIFTAHEKHRTKIIKLSKSYEFPITRIGRMIKTNHIHLLDSAGEIVQVDDGGFKHF